MVAGAAIRTRRELRGGSARRTRKTPEERVCVSRLEVRPPVLPAVRSARSPLLCLPLLPPRPFLSANSISLLEGASASPPRRLVSLQKDTPPPLRPSKDFQTHLEGIQGLCTSDPALPDPHCPQPHRPFSCSWSTPALLRSFAPSSLRHLRGPLHCELLKPLLLRELLLDLPVWNSLYHPPSLTCVGCGQGTCRYLPCVCLLLLLESASFWWVSWGSALTIPAVEPCHTQSR